MTTNDKGNIGLAKAIADLTVKGYQIFLPLTDTTIIDLIISDKSLITKKLQVKYIKLNKNGSITIPLESVVNGKRILNDFNNVDGFAVYCPDTDIVYYIPTNKISSKSFTLKVTTDKRGYNSLRLASDYIDVGVFY